MGWVQLSLGELKSELEALLTGLVGLLTLGVVPLATDGDHVTVGQAGDVHDVLRGHALLPDVDVLERVDDMPQDFHCHDSSMYSRTAETESMMLSC